MSEAITLARLEKALKAAKHFAPLLTASENHHGFALFGTRYRVGEVYPIDPDGQKGEQLCKAICLSRALLPAVIAVLQAKADFLRENYREAQQRLLDFDAEYPLAASLIAHLDATAPGWDR